MHESAGRNVVYFCIFTLKQRHIARFDPVGKVLVLDVLTGFTDKIQDSRDKL